MSNSNSMSTPLMGDQSDDPFYAFRDELSQHVKEARARFDRWKNLLDTTDTSTNSDFKREMSALGKELGVLSTNVSDLEQVLQRVQTHRSNFAHITDDELAKRQRFIREMKNEVNSMRSTLNSSATTGKIDSDRKQNLMRRSGTGTNNGGTEMVGRDARGNGVMSNSSFIADQQQMQQQVIREQDDHLDALHEGATRLGHVAVAIKEEIDEQNVMLDGLQDDIDITSGRMEQALSRVDKLLKSDSRWQTNTILSLIMVLIVLILLVAWT